MNSRMDKYQSNVATKERTIRNKKLYDEVLDLDVEYIDVSTSNKMEIDMNDLTEKTRKNYQKIKEVEALLPTNQKSVSKMDDVVPKEERIYDINEILKQAKENRLFEEESKKRLINTEYNILTKLDMNVINQKEDLSKESLRDLIDTIYQNEDGKKKKRKKREIDDDDDLLADLKETDEFIIDEELSKIILDRAQEHKDDKKKKNIKSPETNPDLNDKVLEETDESNDSKLDSKEETENDEYQNNTSKVDAFLEKTLESTSTLEKDNDFEDTDEDITDLIEIGNRKKRVWIFILILLLAIFLAIGGYYLYQYLSTI